MEPIQETFRYDVFLSFRDKDTGNNFTSHLSFRDKDTGNNFTSHLYGALRRHGYVAFHKTTLRSDLDIVTQLLEAINESRIFIILFSTNYAHSKRCLDQLSHMMHCRHTNANHIILPVFLYVKQSDVATQQGSYQEAFTHHEKEFDQDRVQKWREALREAGELDGFELRNDAKWMNEAALVDQIVVKVRYSIHELILDLDLVGIDSHVQELISLLNPSCDDDVRVVAVCGPAGIGKTTIAKATFNRLAIQIKAQYVCFLPDVKTIFGEPGGKVTLQKMFLLNLLQIDDGQIHIDNYHQGTARIQSMIKNKKILVVLDDVDNDEQLKILGMNRALLGGGSRIIVTTTRDRYVVGRVKPDAMYEPRLLDESESLQVFCLNAFRQSHPKEGYEEVSMEVVRWGAGRCRVLIDTADHLRYFQSAEEWRWVLKDFMHNSS